MGFGDLSISCFAFANNTGEFEDLDSDALIEVGGISLYAQCIGTTTTEFSDTATRVRFSVDQTDENNGGTLDYEQSGYEYNYSYSSSVSVTGNLDFDSITFYE